MKTAISNAVNHAFLSGFVAAREIPAGDEAFGIKAWANYEPHPSIIADLDALFEYDDADAYEIERLRAENATLRERVKLWEPLADPNSVQSGKI